MELRGIVVNVSVEPWLNAFTEDFGKLMHKAVDHGLSEEVAREQAEQLIKNLIPHAVKIK